MSRVAHVPVAARVTLAPSVRKRIETAIQRMVDFLDQFDAPTDDMEPTLGAPEMRMSETVCINGVWSTRQVDQADWAVSGDTAEREEENEHGGDVRDYPHDLETDGSLGDDMEPGCDIAGGDRNRGRYRPSGDGVIGANDLVLSPVGY